MPNKAYSDAPSDTKVKEGKSDKGMKNNDGRLMGGAYDGQHKADFNPKETYSPNDGAPTLKQQPGVEEGAY